MDRRFFLSGTAAWLLAACTPSVETNSATTNRPQPPTPQLPSAAEVAPTTTSAAPLPTVQALATEPVELHSAAFEQGIASGDPTQDSVMLWTRLTGDLPPGVPLVWELSDTADFERLVATGRHTAKAESVHTVRIDVGGLLPASSYYYRFRAGDQASGAGRTRTFVAHGENQQSVRFAVSSCQAKEDGAYAAHRSIAEADVDAVLWLGDYIYGSDTTLADYRSSYARYRSDVALQAAHAAHPWIMIWDDHEIANDFDSSLDPDRLQAGLQAFWENQPIRIPKPNGTGATGHRHFRFGDLCQLVVLDARQHAEPGSLLGQDQEDWLIEAVENDAAWSVVASPVLASGLAAPTGEDQPLLGYTWDGSPSARSRLAGALAEQDAVVLSGDLHTGMVLDFKADPADTQSEAAAPEFMAPSISSAFPSRYATLAPLLGLFNHQLRHIDTTNGWLLLDITAERVQATFKLVVDVEDPNSAVVNGPVFEVRTGESSARQLA